jgi:hypothetical protein
MECPYCGYPKMGKDGLVNGKQKYSCGNCKRKYTEGAEVRDKPSVRVIHPCLYCDKPTKNPQFCSQSCATTYHNLYNPKQYEKRRQNKRRYYCKHCGVEIPKGRTTCDEHNPSIVDWDTITIASVTDRASYQIHGQIRFRARYVYYNSDRPKYCINCGYDTHIEICHIRAIANFPPETTVGEINSLQNLAALCPNCHWELDNGVLPVEVVKAKNDTI